MFLNYIVIRTYVRNKSLNQAVFIMEGGIMKYVKTAYKKHHSNSKTTAGKSSSAAFKVFLAAFVILAACILFISVSVTSASASPEGTYKRSKYYTSISVEQGDTLWGIAASYATDEYTDYYEYIAEVMSINNMKSEHIKSGDKLCIPYYAASPAV